MTKIEELIISINEVLGDTDLLADKFKLAEECCELAAVITASICKQKSQSAKFVEEFSDVFINSLLVYSKLPDNVREQIHSQIEVKLDKLAKYKIDFPEFGIAKLRDI